MVFNTMFNRGRWHGNILAISILAASGVFALSCCAGAFSVGKRAEDRRAYSLAYLENDYHAHRLHYIVQYAKQASDRNDVLFIGDSSCVHSIDVNSFEERTGLKSFNLGATIREGRAGVLLLLEEYLAHHPSPRTIVLVVGPLFFSNFEADRSEAFLWSLGFGSDPRHEKYIRYYCRLGILHAIKELSVQVSIRSSSKDFVEKWRGSLIVDGHNKNTISELILSDVICNEGKKETEKILEVCKSKSIRLILQCAPVKHGHYNDAQHEVRRYLCDLADSHQKVSVAKRQAMEYDDDCFFDLYHLNRDGADRFTEVLAEQVLKAVVQ